MENLSGLTIRRLMPSSRTMPRSPEPGTREPRDRNWGELYFKTAS
jgi:hypothetical protein